MLKASGCVVKINDPFVVIETQPSDACRSCPQASQGCGKAWTFFSPQKTTQIMVINQQALKVGDQVMVGIEERTVLLAAIAVYLIPLAGLVLSMMCYHLVIMVVQLPSQDFLSLLSGLLGFYIGLIFSKRICAYFLNPPLILTIFNS